MAKAGRFPIRIDFTAHLATKGVDVPNAAIVIHSTYFDFDDHATEWPEVVTYELGDNSTSKQILFAQMLNNYHDNSKRDWFFKEISHATLAGLTERK